MNTRFKKSLLAVLLASTLGLAACASTTTKESTGEYLDDSVITTKVKSDLLADKDIHSGNITVTTYKSVVQLSGFVNSPDQVLKAGQVASKVAGVVRVENDLIVK